MVTGMNSLRASRWRFHRQGGWVLALVMGLAGCSSVPLQGPAPVVESGRGPAGSTASVPVIRPAQDGPPDSPPADLASVPDAVPRVEPILPKGPNKPYAVLGQDYEPLAADVPFRQKGLASWYGAKFHGRRTASGEVYSMYAMSAAHRTLPIPSYARVRNTANGKEVIVRINDRGPFHSARVLDLSYTAAAKLELLARGHGEVEIERLTFEDIRTGRWMSPEAAELAVAQASPVANTPPGEVPVRLPLSADPIHDLAARLDGAQPQAVKPAAVVTGAPLPAAEATEVAQAPVRPSPEARAPAFTPGQKGFWVQLAAFGQRPGVDAFQKRVAAELSHLAPLLAVFQEGAWYRLQVGPYARRDEAHGVAQRVREALKLTPMVVERR